MGNPNFRIRLLCSAQFRIRALELTVGRHEPTHPLPLPSREGSFYVVLTRALPLSPVGSAAATWAITFRPVGAPGLRSEIGTRSL